MLRAAIALLLLTVPALAQERLLSLGGAVTETVLALDPGAALVGSDLTSQFPPRAAALPKVGYLRTLGAEGVLSLSPQLVLASADAGPPAALRQIEAAGVRVLSLPEAHTPEAALERVRLVGAALHREAEAQSVAAALRADLAQVQADVAATPGRPKVLFLLSAGPGAPMAAGTGTAADAMVRLAGGINAIEGVRGYRGLSAEAALLAEPDWIVTTSETLRGVGGTDRLLAGPGLAATPAGRARRVAAFDGLYLLGFGPRLAQAQRDLALALHPGATIRPLPARPWAPPS
ncbi:MAG: ABC transporter substrate-binding protein [Acetobacteraceae bacterium]